MSNINVMFHSMEVSTPLVVFEFFRHIYKGHMITKESGLEWAYRCTCMCILKDKEVWIVTYFTGKTIGPSCIETQLTSTKLQPWPLPNSTGITRHCCKSWMYSSGPADCRVTKLPFHVTFSRRKRKIFFILHSCESHEADVMCDVF